LNSFERVTRRLRGDPVDRPPNFNIFMTFAAHFIGQPLSRYYRDYKVLAEANLSVLEAFDLDIVQTISDPFREADDLGVNIAYPEDDLPKKLAPLLFEPEDIKKISAPAPNPGPRMADRLKAIQYLHDKVGDDVPVMGWVEGALAQATLLRGDINLLMDLSDRPDWVEELLEICVELEIDFAKAQVESGAHIIGVGDAIASQISPGYYAKYALPYQKRIIEAVHQAGALARLHICGDTTHILELMSQSGADIIDIDWMVDIGKAAEIFGEGPAVCGNFDPVRIMLQGSPEDVNNAVCNCLHHGGNRMISAAGCEIPDKTPLQNLYSHTRALKDYSP
jgi:MtaA/CmuA family methyltransferase